MLDVEPRECATLTNGNDEVMIAASENNSGNPEDDIMMQARGLFDGPTKNVDGLAKPCWPGN